MFSIMPYFHKDAQGFRLNDLTSLLFQQKKDKKFLCQLANDKKYLEKILNQISGQKDTPSKFQGNVQKQVNFKAFSLLFPIK